MVFSFSLFSLHPKCFTVEIYQNCWSIANETRGLLHLETAFEILSPQRGTKELVAADRNFKKVWVTLIFALGNRSVTLAIFSASVGEAKERKRDHSFLPSQVGNIYYRLLSCGAKRRRAGATPGKWILACAVWAAKTDFTVFNREEKLIFHCSYDLRAGPLLVSQPAGAFLSCSFVTAGFGISGLGSLLLFYIKRERSMLLN